MIWQDWTLGVVAVGSLSLSICNFALCRRESRWTKEKELDKAWREKLVDQYDEVLGLQRSLRTGENLANQDFCLAHWNSLTTCRLNARTASKEFISEISTYRYSNLLSVGRRFCETEEAQPPLASETCGLVSRYRLRAVRWNSLPTASRGAGDGIRPGLNSEKRQTLRRRRSNTR